MSSNITAPDEGDDVVLKDGRTGTVGDQDDIVWNGGNDWQVSVVVKTEGEGDDEEDEEEVVTEVDIRPDEVTGGLWKEV